MAELKNENIDPKFPLGRRISVEGKGGKTTLSKALAKRFGLDFIEQDAIRHQANWVELPIEQHRDVLQQKFSEAEVGWVSDGNYRDINDLVMAEVDTVIVLGFSLRVMMWRTFKRTLGRSFRRKVLWNGNRENWWISFFSRESVLYDIWIRRERFRSYATRSRDGMPDEATLIVIHSPHELDDLYEKHGLVRE
ncbi:MAG: adenylate kinase [Chloroflexi bacterium]|jgi:adenylate kinase family enzyme|nr:adenylate kinase [Chloroflexota bacterium]